MDKARFGIDAAPDDQTGPGGKESGMTGVIIAIISGALMSIQGVFNTGVTRQAGIWTTSAFVHFTALAVCIAAWFIGGREGSFAAVFGVDQKYMLLGGAIGAFITYTVVKSMQSLGPARSVMLIVTSQVLVAYLIELFGWFGADKAAFEWKKLFGILLAAAGIVIFKWE